MKGVKNILIEKRTQLDFNMNTCPLLYTIQQFEENSRILIIEITKNGELFDISKFSLIQLQLDKPDGTTIVEDSNGDYLSIENNNTIRILFGKHMADISGFTVGKIMFYDNQSMVATTLFKIRIENGLTSLSDIITPSEYDSLVELLNKILSQAENINTLYEKVDDLEDDLESEVQRAINAENNISTDVGTDNFYTKSQINNMLHIFDIVEVIEDLDNYTVNGFYKHSTTSTSIRNSPTLNPFFLIVGQSNHPYQIIYDDNGDIYRRINVNSTWTTWLLLNPRTVDDELDNTSDNAVKNKVITRFLNEINAKLLEIIENFDNYYDKDEVDIFQNKFSVIKIITGSDLNTYTSCGFYSFDSGNLINCPTQTSFFMITGLSNNSPYQIIYDFNNDIYIRQKYSNSIENIWQDWRCVTNPIVIDDALNTVSLNPVENRVITERLNEILSIIDTTGYTIQEICDYFTSEKIIGTWVDGKTLYQKAIHIPTMPNSTTLVIDADVEDLYEIIDFRGYCRPKDKTSYPLSYTRPLPNPSPDSINSIRVDSQNGYIRVITASNWSIYEGFLIIRYTKKTDEPINFSNSLENAILNTDFPLLNTEHKDLPSAINELFQSVSNGKKLIASAITDKGVETDANDKFATMAENIGKIDGGSSGGCISIPIDLNQYADTYTYIFEVVGSMYRYLKLSSNGSTANTSNHYVEVQAFDDNGVNVALGKTSNVATDGVYNNSSAYIDLGVGNQTLTIDLGGIYKLDYIRVWHYYGDGRTYHDVVVSASVDGVDYDVLFDSNVDGEYAETPNGKTIYIN